MPEQTIAEEWQPVNGYPGYRVSNHGRIQSRRKVGPGVHLRDKWRDLKPRRTRSGHLSVQLCTGDYRKIHCLVHRLVLEAFAGPCPTGCVTCHNDGNPANNFIGNLRWDTAESNYRDRDRHGTTARGERNGGGRKLTEAQVVEIKRRLAEGQLPGKIALSFPVTPGMIDHIMNGRAWRHVVIG